MTQTTPTKEQFEYAKKLAAQEIRLASQSPDNDDGYTNLARCYEALAAQLAEANERTVSVSFSNHPLRGGVEREYTLDDIEPLLKRAEQAEAAAASARETALKYGCHTEECGGTLASNDMPCDCGWVQAEAALKSTPAPVTPGAPPIRLGWRFDMKNAPRGEFISLWCPEDKSRWHAAWQDGRWHGVDEHGLTRTDGYHIGSSRVTGWLITAWRPLPSPPTAREGDR